MYQPRAVRCRGLRHVVARLPPAPPRSLLAALEQDADQVDHHIGAAHRCLDRGRIAQVRLHGVDLSDAAERLEMARKVGPPHGGADAIALARERPHHMAAEET